MLHLQRASAGSGKTYTLARTFITDYLVATADDGSHRLRFKEELADALPRILAVTFTNKATNEMKQRIVERLAELSHPTAKTPYLAELRELTGSSTALIAKMAGEALAVLLNNYSDFKVSTIDSFFQTILRTFAYETDLNDTYQIELDSDYVAEASLKALLDDIDARRNPRGESWASHIMRKAQRNDNKGWNVFQDSTAATSVYRRIIGSIKRLESEDFKQIREDLDIWAGEHPGLRPGLRRGGAARGGPAEEAPHRDARRHEGAAPPLRRPGPRHRERLPGIYVEPGEEGALEPSHRPRHKDEMAYLGLRPGGREGSARQKAPRRHARRAARGGGGSLRPPRGMARRADVARLQALEHLRPPPPLSGAHHGAEEEDQRVSGDHQLRADRRDQLHTAPHHRRRRCPLHLRAPRLAHQPLPHRRVPGHLAAPVGGATSLGGDTLRVSSSSRR